jgi:hypothetical protein
MFLPEVADLMLYERDIKSSRLFQLVGLDAADVVWTLGAQVVDQRAQRDLELSSRGRRTPASSSTRVA